MKVLGYLIAAVLILALPGASAALQVQVLPFQTRDLLFNPVDGRIYASVPGTVPTYGNTVTAIDPATGALGPSVFVGSEPGKLALSDDGTTLYVALRGAPAVRVVDLTTLTAGLQFTLGSDPFAGPFYADDMAVQPGHPNVVAVSLTYLDLTPGHAGVAIFDNGIARPARTQDAREQPIEFQRSVAHLRLQQ
jgi:DNA-binding beta-propeller fold protein YncE